MSPMMVRKNGVWEPWATQTSGGGKGTWAVPTGVGIMNNRVDDAFFEAVDLILPPSCYGLFSDMAMTKLPLLDTSKVTNASNMFAGCLNLKSVPALDFRATTDATYAFFNCKALTNIDAYGFRYSVDIRNCALPAAAINKFFSNLGTAASSGSTVNITANPGASTCDRTIATAKGWTVTG